ncbi:MAG: hypothetical protein I3274_03520 [Candidatus Moeniiplasma glomeromycotorum]|nr:hypothetical protein [Candidatus Moeniiplasma glomeromycotorum]
MVVAKLEDKYTLCFSFCQDLGNKEFHALGDKLNSKGELDPNGKIIGLDRKINIKWGLFRVKQTYGLFGGGSAKLDDLNNVWIPGNYKIERVGSWTDIAGSKEKSYEVFLAPDDYYQNSSLIYRNPKTLTIQLPETLIKQPHLYKHSTFQFLFLRNVLFSTSLQFLEINPQNQIQAKVGIYASPTGTYFVFHSGEIPFKWKIEVRQGVVVMDLMKETIEAIQKTGKKIGAGIVKGMTGGLVSLDGSEGDAIEGLMGGMGGKDNWEKMGLNRERVQRIQEQQTERLFKSTITDALDKTIEPSIFYTNSVQFPYNLFDFFIRYFTPIWEARVHISKNLYNNLVHNNNENPITFPLNITFQKLGNILRKGYWQGKLTLDYDPGGNMAKCFARGVFFYEDKEKDFPNPDLTFSGVRSSRTTIGMPVEPYTAQALVEPGEGITVNIPYTADQRGYSHSTFIRLTNSSVMDSFKNALVSSCGANAGSLHYDSSSGFCWGCTYDELNRVNFASFKFTPSSDCSVVLKLDVSSSATKDLDLKAGTEYTVTISSTQFIFKAQDKSRIVLQKVPGHDDFEGMDWTPPPGSGGDTDIPFSNPDVGVDPTKDPEGPLPEPDFVPDLGDMGPGEPEITPLEPDFTQEPDFPDEPDWTEPEIPEPEYTPEPEPPTSEPEPDKPKDKGDKDPNDDEPEKPEDFD